MASKDDSPSKEKEIEEAIETDKQSRDDRKHHFDKKKQALEKPVCVGHTFLIKQNESTLKLPFYLAPYKVIYISENNETLKRGNKKLKQNFNLMKVIRKANS